MTTPTILDATTGGKHIWHEQMKDDDRVVFSDLRNVDEGELEVRRQNWSVDPDVLADTRQLPYKDESFDLVCFDPPHRVNENGMDQLTGILLRKYGALRAETWQADLKASFDELWRVLRPGDTLTFKWADETKAHGEVLDQLDQTPLYGTNTAKGDDSTKWWVFHKSRSREDRDES